VTTDELARFLESPTGKLYGRVCEHYGHRPGEPLEDEDDVMAFALDAAFFVQAVEHVKSLDQPEMGDLQPADGRIVTDLARQMAEMERG